MASATEMGVVQYWHAARAYGWITTARSLSCYFVHITDVVDRVELHPGAQVHFVPITTDRGPRATVVRVIAPGSVAAEEGT